MTTTTLKLATLIYRHLNKSSRIVESIKYVRNGNTTKQYGCALCGACSPTWSGAYRVTKRVLDWCDKHRESSCALQYVSEHLDVVAELGYELIDNHWVKGSVDVGALADAYHPQAVAS